MKKKHTIITTNKFHIESDLDGNDLEHLMMTHPDYKDCWIQGGKFEFYVTVPGGGDWSGEDLEINSDTMLTVRQFGESTETTEE